MQISFHDEEFPDGVEFDLGGILLVNGETIVVSEDEENLYYAKHGETLKEAVSRNVHCGGHYVEIQKTDEELAEEKAKLLGVSPDNAAITNPPEDNEEGDNA